MNSWRSRNPNPAASALRPEGGSQVSSVWSFRSIRFLWLNFPSGQPDKPSPISPFPVVPRFSLRTQDPALSPCPYRPYLSRLTFHASHASLLRSRPRKPKRRSVTECTPLPRLSRHPLLGDLSGSLLEFPWSRLGNRDASASSSFPSQTPGGAPPLRRKYAKGTGSP